LTAKILIFIVINEGISN